MPLITDDAEALQHPVVADDEGCSAGVCDLLPLL